MFDNWKQFQMHRFFGDQNKKSVVWFVEKVSNYFVKENAVGKIII